MSAILDKLEINQIFTVKVNGDKSVTFREACDMYHKVDLTKKELGELIKELQSISKRLK